MRINELVAPTSFMFCISARRENTLAFVVFAIITIEIIIRAKIITAQMIEIFHYTSAGKTTEDIFGLAG